MNLLSMALLAIAMSTDAFAAAVSKGAQLDHPQWREALRTGAIFGSIEAVTRVIGWRWVKFTPAGGHISVAVQQTLDEYVLISVSDSGSGIRPDRLRHVFDRST